MNPIFFITKIKVFKTKIRQDNLIMKKARIILLTMKVKNLKIKLKEKTLNQMNSKFYKTFKMKTKNPLKDLKLILLISQPLLKKPEDL